MKLQTDGQTWFSITSLRATRRLQQIEATYLFFSGVPTTAMSAPSKLKFLLANGESLESLGELYGLNAAAFHGHSRLCQFLIEQGADVNKPQLNTGETPLHAALQ